MALKSHQQMFKKKPKKKRRRDREGFTPRKAFGAALSFGVLALGLSALNRT